MASAQQPDVAFATSSWNLWAMGDIQSDLDLLMDQALRGISEQTSARSPNLGGNSRPNDATVSRGFDGNQRVICHTTKMHIADMNVLWLLSAGRRLVDSDIQREIDAVVRADVDLNRAKPTDMNVFLASPVVYILSSRELLDRAKGQIVVMLGEFPKGEWNLRSLLCDKLCLSQNYTLFGLDLSDIPYLLVASCSNLVMAQMKETEFSNRCHPDHDELPSSQSPTLAVFHNCMKLRTVATSSECEVKCISCESLVSIFGSKKITAANCKVLCDVPDADQTESTIMQMCPSVPQVRWSNFTRRDFQGISVDRFDHWNTKFEIWPQDLVAMDVPPEHRLSLYRQAVTNSSFFITESTTFNDGGPHVYFSNPQFCMPQSQLEYVLTQHRADCYSLPPVTTDTPVTLYLLPPSYSDTGRPVVVCEKKYTGGRDLAAVLVRHYFRSGRHLVVPVDYREIRLSQCADRIPRYNFETQSGYVVNDTLIFIGNIPLPEIMLYLRRRGHYYTQLVLAENHTFERFDTAREMFGKLELIGCNRVQYLNAGPYLTNLSVLRCISLQTISGYGSNALVRAVDCPALTEIRSIFQPLHVALCPMLCRVPEYWDKPWDIVRIKDFVKIGPGCFSMPLPSRRWWLGIRTGRPPEFLPALTDLSANADERLEAWVKFSRQFDFDSNPLGRQVPVQFPQPPGTYTLYDGFDAGFFIAGTEDDFRRRTQKQLSLCENDPTDRRMEYPVAVLRTALALPRRVNRDEIDWHSGVVPLYRRLEGDVLPPEIWGIIKGFFARFDTDFGFSFLPTFAPTRGAFHLLQTHDREEQNRVDVAIEDANENGDDDDDDN
jgi:hypothetical protein